MFILLNALVPGFNLLMMDVHICWFHSFTWVKSVLSKIAHYDLKIMIIGSSSINSIFLFNIYLERDFDGVSGSFRTSKLLENFERVRIDEYTASGQAGKPSLNTATDRPYPVEERRFNKFHMHINQWRQYR